MDNDEFTYDIALSFAGENRPYVEQVAAALKGRDVRVFYDDYERAILWGKDLYVHMSDVYRTRARYTAIFISKHYAAKVWTNHERQSAQARALVENEEYILPVRFDDTELPGLPSTVAYVNANSTPPLVLAEIIEEKLRLSGRGGIAANQPEQRGVNNTQWRGLAVGLSEQYVEARLGIPPVRRKVRSEGFIEAAYSYPQYYVQVIYDDARQLAFYAITVTDPSLRLDLPVIGGVLGEKTFVEYPGGRELHRCPYFGRHRP